MKSKQQTNPERQIKGVSAEEFTKDLSIPTLHPKKLKKKFAGKQPGSEKSK